MTAEAARRGRWWSSVRLRIVVGYVVLVAAALAISILVTRQVLLGRLERDIDRALTQEVEELRNLASGNNPLTGEPFGSDAEAILDTFLRRSVPGANEAFYAFVGGERFLSSFDAPQEVWNDERLVDDWASVTEPLQATERTDVVGEITYLAVPLIASGETTGAFVVAHFPATDRDEIIRTPQPSARRCRRATTNRRSTATSPPCWSVSPPARSGSSKPIGLRRRGACST